jgi:hypothetical protein
MNHICGTKFIQVKYFWIYAGPYVKTMIWWIWAEKVTIKNILKPQLQLRRILNIHVGQITFKKHIRS